MREKREWEENSAGRVGSGSQIGGKRGEPFPNFSRFFFPNFSRIFPFFPLWISTIFSSSSGQLCNMKMFISN